MTPDPLDDLLTRSAPPTRAAQPEVLGTMIAEASRTPRPDARAGRRRRLGIAAGAVAGALLIGTAGVAVATDGFTWAPWLSDPVGEYALTLPSGLECSVRIAHYTAADPAVADEVNRIVEDWWRDADVADEAAVVVPAMIEQIRSAENVVTIAETGETVPGGFGTEWYDADQEYHFAFAQAIGELEHDVLAAHGITTEELGLAGLEGGYAIQCLDENGEVTIP